MTRDAFADRLLDLAYGELSGRDAREVEAHAATCEACSAELARIRETRRLMSALPEEAPRPGGERILLAAAREAAGARAPRRRLAPWLWGATAAAFSIVAVAAVSWRILAMRPGPLARPDSEALLGGGSWSPPPAPPPASGAPAGGEATARALRHDAPPAAEVAPAPERARRARARASGDAQGAHAEAPAGAAPAEGESRAEAERFAAAPPARPAEVPEVPEVAEAPAARPADERQASAARPADERQASAGQRAKRAAPVPAPSAAGLPSAAEDRAAMAAPPPPAAEVRTFAGCEGEALRRVERDPEGRLVRYVREGRIAGRRLRVEHVYGPDGALARATARDLDAPGAVLDARALGLELPARAEEAGIDAPPRCGR